MSEENFQTRGPVPVGGNLKAVVAELVRGLPVGAHGIIVIVYSDGLHEVSGGTIMGLPVRFDPTFGTPKLAGTVSVGFEVGNLESFRIPPPGVLGME